MNASMLFVQWRFLSLALLGSLLFISCVMFIQTEPQGLAYGVLRGVGDSQLEIAGPEKSAIENQLPATFENPTSTALNQILKDLIIENANTSYHPDKYKDMDLAEFTRQTVIFKDLLRIYETLPDPSSDSAASRMDRIALRESVDTLQKILFPWMTDHKIGEPGVDSIFSLAESFRQDAGIVIATGKGGFRWTVHQVSTLRNVLNCKLPIEIFYAGDADLPPDHRKVFEEIALNSTAGGTIRTVDISKLFPDPHGVMGMPGGWALRPFAILASSFKKVILSDADTVFLQNPELLLEEPGFKKTGALFYHDRILSPAQHETYEWLDNMLEEVNAKHLEDLKKDSGWFERKTYYEMESGAVLIDKSTNLVANLMICHLNLKAQRDSITYKRFYGDKESYWVGHALTSTPYHFVKGYSGGIGPISRKGQVNSVEASRLTEEERIPYEQKLEKADEIICTLQILHVLESNGLPLWFNNGLVEYKGDSNDKFIQAEGWVGHDGHWSGGPTRFPNELCIEQLDGEFDRILGEEKPKKSVNRFSTEMAHTIEGLIQEAKRWDRRCEELGLYVVTKTS